MFSTMASTAHELNSSAYYTTNVGSSLSDSFSVSSFKHENVTSAMNERLPEYLRTTSMVVCIVVMILGVVGNLMVPLVVLRGKDMRNSTNIFLVNLSVADLCVLLVCAPTVLVEVNSNPQVWPLGEHMCKAVPFVEMTVAHASVLTILAISFERYYAICEPLRAGYVCTKARATFLCFLAWATAALCTSPMIWVTQYEHRNLDENVTASWSKNDSSSYPVCTTPVITTLALVYFVLMNFLLFALPLLMLVILYSAIVRHLVRDSSTTNGGDSYHVRARKQVVLMLLAVIFCFFVCLTPFRIFTLYLALGPSADVNSMKPKTFYNVLYFTRNMFYLNSAINPILYNLMSTRFRAGFLKLCGLRKRRNISSGTFRSTVTGSRFSKRATRKEQQENFL